MTDTITDTLSLDRDSLTLVVVSPDYFRTGEANHLMPNGNDESRTYYATVARGLGGEWATLIDPVDRGRLSGWDATYDYRDLVGEGHNGWNIQRHYLSPVTPDTTPDPTPESFTYLGHRIELDNVERSRLPREEAYPVGSVWNHFNSGRAVVTGHPQAMPEYVTVRNAAGQTQEWVRGALDLDSTTFVGWEDETPSQEATESPVTAEQVSGGTFTQEDIDRAVREAREAARLEAERALEEFKETANARAVQYAEENSLCGQFERCMADIGLMGREEWREAHQREFNVRFIVTVRGVLADNDEDASDKARDALYDELPSNMDEDITFYGVEEF